MKKFETIEDLKSVVYDKWSELNEIKEEYLSDTGKAAKEAYRAIIWYMGFHDDLNSLRDDEEFMNLVNIGDKHPEFYKILRMFYRALDNSIV